MDFEKELIILNHKLDSFYYFIKKKFKKIPKNEKKISKNLMNFLIILFENKFEQEEINLEKIFKKLFMCEMLFYKYEKYSDIQKINTQEIYIKFIKLKEFFLVFITDNNLIKYFIQKYFNNKESYLIRLLNKLTDLKKYQESKNQFQKFRFIRIFIYRRLNFIKKFFSEVKKGNQVIKIINKIKEKIKTAYPTDTDFSILEDSFSFIKPIRYFKTKKEIIDKFKKNQTYLIIFPSREYIIKEVPIILYEYLDYEYPYKLSQTNLEEISNCKDYFHDIDYFINYKEIENNFNIINTNVKKIVYIKNKPNFSKNIEIIKGNNPEKIYLFGEFSNNVFLQYGNFEGKDHFTKEDRQLLIYLKQSFKIKDDQILNEFIKDDPRIILNDIMYKRSIHFKEWVNQLNYILNIEDKLEDYSPKI